MLTVVFCDSVLGGPHHDAPPVRDALVLAGLDGELRVFGFALRLLRQQRRELNRVIPEQPDLVFLSHGGSESLTFPRPFFAGRRAPSWEGKLGVKLRRSGRLADARRRYGRRLGRNTPVSAKAFDRDLRKFVNRLLSETSAHIILVKGSGSDNIVFERDLDFVASWGALLKAVAEASDRITLIDPQKVLDKWDDYRPDHAHLNPEGQRKVGVLIAEMLQTLPLKPQSPAGPAAETGDRTGLV